MTTFGDVHVDTMWLPSNLKSYLHMLIIMMSKMMSESYQNRKIISFSKHQLYVPIGLADYH